MIVAVDKCTNTFANFLGSLVNKYHGDERVYWALVC